MEYIPIKSFDTYILANLWLGRFLDAGIDCYLKDEYTVTIDPMLTNAVGGIKLCVSDAQLADAKNLMQEMEETVRQNQKCPRCKGTNVQYISQPNNPTNWLGAIATWFLGSYAISSKQVYHCFDCKYEFDEIAVSND
jgi:hypothetical protein